MAKKSRRARAKFRAVQQVGSTEVAKSSRTTVEEATEIKVQPKTAKSTTSVSTVAPEVKYQHVIPELIRISIIAGILFVICIVISFIIK